MNTVHNDISETQVALVSSISIIFNNVIKLKIQSVAFRELVGFSEKQNSLHSMAVCYLITKFRAVASAPFHNSPWACKAGYCMSEDNPG